MYENKIGTGVKRGLQIHLFESWSIFGSKIAKKTFFCTLVKIVSDMWWTKLKRCSFGISDLIRVPCSQKF